MTIYPMHVIVLYRFVLRYFNKGMSGFRHNTYWHYLRLDFDLKYIQEHGFNTPILFKQKDGLGMRYVFYVKFQQFA